MNFQRTERGLQVTRGRAEREDVTVFVNVNLELSGSFFQPALRITLYAQGTAFTGVKGSPRVKTSAGRFKRIFAFFHTKTDTLVNFKSTTCITLSFI